jgi:dTMP kinase
MGIDGSGKSTQAKELLREFERRGLAVRHVDNRFEEWAVRPLLKLGKRLFLRRSNREENYSDHQRSVKRLFTNPWFSFVRGGYIVGCQVAHGILKVRLPLARRTHVICERYVYDAVSVLSIEHGCTEETTNQVFGMIWKLLPRPDLLFLIDVPVETAWSRKDDIPSPEYLKEYREAYRAIADREGAIIINGCDSIEDNKARISSAVNRALEGDHV